MPKDDFVYVGHILEMAHKIVGIVSSFSREQFDREEVTRIALTHFLQIIGEAARRVSPEFCQQHPEIPWREITGMRNKIVHDYLSIDEDIVWNAVTSDIPALIPMLKQVMSLSSGNE